MRKTSRYRALHLEGKCRASPGRTKGAVTKVPLFPPPVPTMVQKEIIFSAKD